MRPNKGRFNIFYFHHPSFFRVAVNAAVDRVLNSLFYVISRSRLEEDRLLFTLMVAIDVSLK